MIQDDFMRSFKEDVEHLKEDVEHLVFHGQPRTAPEIKTPRPGEPTEPGWYWARWDPGYTGVTTRLAEKSPRSVVRVDRELRWGRMAGQPEPPTELMVISGNESFSLSAFSGWIGPLAPPEEP